MTGRINHFSKYKDELEPLNPWRRVPHSIGASWRHMTGMERALKTAEGGDAVGSGLGVWGTGAAIIAGSTTGLASAPAAAGLGVVGIVGLCVAAYNAKTNRDELHKKLAKYTWSYIDDEAPTQIPANDEGQKVVTLALELIIQGSTQLQESVKKFNEKAHKMESFVQSLSNATVHHRRLKNQISRSPRGIDDVEDKYIMNVIKSGDELWKLIEGALKKNGDVGEFMRRCVHYGNYLQAPTIVSNSLEGKYHLDDFAKKIPHVEQTRKNLAKLAEYIDEMLSLEEKAREVDTRRENLAKRWNDPGARLGPTELKAWWDESPRNIANKGMVV